MKDAAFIAVAVMAIGNAWGRVVAGMLSDKIGRQWTLMMVLVFQAILMFVAIPVIKSPDGAPAGLGEEDHVDPLAGEARELAPHRLDLARRDRRIVSLRCHRAAQLDGHRPFRCHQLQTLPGGLAAARSLESGGILQHRRGVAPIGGDVPGPARVEFRLARRGVRP